ncbi:MAG: hypothetical protein ABR507_03120 [Actinomycetota bacterium]
MQKSAKAAALTKNLSRVAIVVAAVAGLYLAKISGFPTAWSPHVSMWQRFGLPSALSMPIGLLSIVLTVLTPRELRIPHVRFPKSILVYTEGGLLEEALFRFIALPAIVWLVSHVLLNGRAFTAVFWAATGLLAVAYTATQFLGVQKVMASKGSAVPGVVVAQLILAAPVYSVLASWVFKMAGPVAPLVMRFWVYLIWHIIWGAIAVESGAAPERTLE